MRNKDQIHPGGDFERKTNVLALGSAPTFSKTSFASGMNLAGSPESCRSPFHFLARTGSARKSSKKGFVEKVSVRAIERAPEGYVCRLAKGVSGPVETKIRGAYGVPEIHCSAVGALVPLNGCDTHDPLCNQRRGGG